MHEISNKKKSEDGFKEMCLCYSKTKTKRPQIFTVQINLNLTKPTENKM